MFVLAATIVSPIHYKYVGNRGIPGEPDQGGDDAEKKKSDPNYLSMYVIFTYIFSGLAMYLLFRETNNVIRTRQRYLGSQTSTTDRTIRLSGIPREMRSEGYIKELIEGLQIGKVENVTLCHDWLELDLLIDQRLNILRNLERAWIKYTGYKRTRGDGSIVPLARQEACGASFVSDDDHERSHLLSESDRDRVGTRKRPTLRVWYGPFHLRYRNIDAIDCYEEKLRRIDETIHAARRKTYTPTGLAFVTMESIAASQMVVQAILDPHPMQLFARLAPAPADVVWKNTYLPRARRMMQSWFITAVIGFLTIFWSVLLLPVASLLDWETLHKVFPPLADILARNPVAMSLVQTGLPTLAISLLTVAVPYLYTCRFFSCELSMLTFANDPRRALASSGNDVWWRYRAISDIKEFLLYVLQPVSRLHGFRNCVDVLWFLGTSPGCFQGCDDHCLCVSQFVGIICALLHQSFGAAGSGTVSFPAFGVWQCCDVPDQFSVRQNTARLR